MIRYFTEKWAQCLHLKNPEKWKLRIKIQVKHLNIVIADKIKHQEKKLKALLIDICRSGHSSPALAVSFAIFWSLYDVAPDIVGIKSLSI